MRRILSTLLVLAWGLWFGGLIVLFMAVSSLFKTFSANHETAGQAASAIFRIFDTYQLALAAIVLIAGLTVPHPGCRRAKWIMLAMFGCATAAAVVISLWLTPQIEELRLAAQTNSEHFKNLHGMSMGIYLLETCLVFLAGLILPSAIERASSN